MYDIVGKRRAAERGLRDPVVVEHVDLSPVGSGDTGGDAAEGATAASEDR